MKTKTLETMYAEIADLVKDNKNLREENEVAAQMRTALQKVWDVDGMNWQFVDGLYTCGSCLSSGHGHKDKYQIDHEKNCTQGPMAAAMKAWDEC